ncbi:MAG TPA: hypothetical protein VKA37_08220 [Halobacteriales archaeon]|nr:hypothetical protein [Halobacteriales archaeon]
MIGRWLSPSRSAGEERVDREASYECSHCRAAVAEWTEDCPRCGELVVRVVDPSDRAIDGNA